MYSSTLKCSKVFTDMPISSIKVQSRIIPSGIGLVVQRTAGGSYSRYPVIDPRSLWDHYKYKWYVSI